VEVHGVSAKIKEECVVAHRALWNRLPEAAQQCEHYRRAKACTDCPQDSATPAAGSRFADGPGPDEKVENHKYECHCVSGAGFGEFLARSTTCKRSIFVAMFSQVQSQSLFRNSASIATIFKFNWHFLRH
jgi:hypothetical protein